MGFFSNGHSAAIFKSVAHAQRRSHALEVRHFGTPGDSKTGPRKTAALCQKYVILFALMAILKKNAFSRRVPDLVTEELVAVLSRRSSFEFKQLFDIVHENLRARNAASGGEEMLRLRAYEKLQNLVARGAVKKNGKKYKGLPSALANAIAPQNGHIPSARLTTVK
jgi:hypothetical protein